MGAKVTAMSLLRPVPQKKSWLSVNRNIGTFKIGQYGWEKMRAQIIRPRWWNRFSTRVEN